MHTSECSSTGIQVVQFAAKYIQKPLLLLPHKLTQHISKPLDSKLTNIFKNHLTRLPHKLTQHIPKPLDTHRKLTAWAT